MIYQKIAIQVFQSILRGYLYREDVENFEDFIFIGIKMMKVEVLNTLAEYNHALKLLRWARHKIESHGRKSVPQVMLLHSYVLYWECWIYRITGQIKKAEDSGQNALEVLSTIEIDKRHIQSFERMRRKILAHIKKGLARISVGRSDYKKAIEVFFENLQYYSEVDNELGKAGCLVSLGTVYRILGDYSEAKRMFNRALSIYKESGNIRDIGAVLANIGTVYYLQGKQEKTMQVYKKALKIYKQIGESRSVAGILYNLGLLFRARGEYTRAEHVLKETLEVMKKVGDKQSTGMVYGTLGIININLGKYKRAERMYRRYLQISEQIGNKQEAGRAYGMLGELFTKTGKPELAEYNLLRAESIFVKIGERAALAETYFSYARLFKGKGEKTRMYLDKAKRLFTVLNLTHKVEEIEKFKK